MGYPTAGKTATIRERGMGGGHNRSSPAPWATGTRRKLAGYAEGHGKRNADLGRLQGTRGKERSYSPAAPDTALNSIRPQFGRVQKATLRERPRGKKGGSPWIARDVVERFLTSGLREVPSTRVCATRKTRIEKGAPDNQNEPALQINVGSYSFQSWILEDIETAEAYVRIGIIVADAPINLVSLTMTPSEARTLTRMLIDSLEIMDLDDDLDDDD